MHIKTTTLARNWVGTKSLLSPRAVDAKRVTLRTRQYHGDENIAIFDIMIDGVLTFRAYDQIPDTGDLKAFVIMQTGPNIGQVFYLTQFNPCAIPMRSIAYALSMWYTETLPNPTHPIQISAMICLACELRFSRHWTTLYAKAPLLRAFNDSYTFSRNKALPPMLRTPNVREELMSLHDYLLNVEGNKLQIHPIVYSHNKRR